MKRIKARIDSELSGVRVRPELRAKLLRAAEREAQRRQWMRLFGGVAGIAASLALAVGLAMMMRGFRLVMGGGEAGATRPPLSQGQAENTAMPWDSESEEEESRGFLSDGNFTVEPTVAPTGTPESTAEHEISVTDVRFAEAAAEDGVQYAGVEDIAVASVQIAGGETAMAEDQVVEYLAEDVQMQFLSYNGRALVARFFITAQEIGEMDIQIEPLNDRAEEAVNRLIAQKYIRYQLKELEYDQFELTVMALLDEYDPPEKILVNIGLGDQMIAMVETGYTDDIVGVSVQMVDKEVLHEYDVKVTSYWESTMDTAADLALSSGVIWLAPPVAILDMTVEQARYDVDGPYYHASAACAAESAGLVDGAIEVAQRPLAELLAEGKEFCPACMPEGDSGCDLSSCFAEDGSDGGQANPLQDLEVLTSDGLSAEIAGWREVSAQDAVDQLVNIVSMYGDLSVGEDIVSAMRLSLVWMPTNAAEYDDIVSFVDSTIANRGQ